MKKTDEYPTHHLNVIGWTALVGGVWLFTVITLTIRWQLGGVRISTVTPLIWWQLGGLVTAIISGLGLWFLAKRSVEISAIRRSEFKKILEECTDVFRCCNLIGIRSGRYEEARGCREMMYDRVRSLLLQEYRRQVADVRYSDLEEFSRTWLDRNVKPSWINATFKDEMSKIKNRKLDQLEHDKARDGIMAVQTPEECAILEEQLATNRHYYVDYPRWPDLVNLAKYRGVALMLQRLQGESPKQQVSVMGPIAQSG